MANNFSFDNYDLEKLQEKRKIELLNNLDTSNKNKTEEKGNKKKINFQKLPDNIDSVLEISPQDVQNAKDKMKDTEELVGLPFDNSATNSYLSLVLSPNLRELELMIRGLEYVKKTNQFTGKEEIVLRKIANHPLNDYGINQIMQELKVYTSPEIKLGRKRPRDYYHSVQQIGRSIVRLIYKNLKNFGMDTQVKQRNAKTFCLAIIEMVDSSYSRSIEGKENDLSRATEFKVEGNINSLNDPAQIFNKNEKDKLKN